MKLLFSILFAFAQLVSLSQVKFTVTSKKTEAKSAAAFRYCNPIIEVGGHKGTSTIASKEIPALGFLKVINCDSATYKIISFDLTLRRKGSPCIYKGRNASLNPFKKEMLEVKPDGKIFIDNVQVQRPDSSIVIAPGLILVIQ